MTAEQVYKLSKAYRLYFTADYDIFKYKWAVKTPPLIQDTRRQFYHRLANKLSDTQIHATLTVAHFFKPEIFITDIVSQEHIDAGVQFDSRRENGTQLYCRDLYDLRKRVKVRDLDEWLYGAFTDGQRSGVPGCISDILNRSLPLDLACLLLLVPRPELDYQWVKYWEEREPQMTSFGVRPWIERLKKVDRLLQYQRTGWRQDTHRLSKIFWASSYLTPAHSSFAPLAEEVTLFA